MIDIIFDTDAVGDDILALFFGALHEDIRMHAVTTSCGASGSIEQANNVALNMLDLAGRSDIPVYAGRAGPLVSRDKDLLGAPVHFDQTMKGKFGDRLKKFNPPSPKAARSVGELTASDFIIKKINECPGITVVATGPLTNLGEALQKDPSIASKVKEAYIMGGCFHTPGNITPVVEYNIWADALAAKIVFNSGMNITIVPLDVCENNSFADGMLTRDHLADFSEKGGEISDFMNDRFPIYIDMWREFFQLGGFPMDDVIAIALAADETLCKYTARTFVDVELEGRLTSGQTIAYFGYQIIRTDEGKPRNIRIAESVEGKRFMNLFVETLLGK